MGWACTAKVLAESVCDIYATACSERGSPRASGPAPVLPPFLIVAGGLGEQVPYCCLDSISLRSKADPFCVSWSCVNCLLCVYFTLFQSESSDPPSFAA